jgi:hypothetical protein
LPGGHHSVSGEWLPQGNSSRRFQHRRIVNTPGLDRQHEMRYRRDDTGLGNQLSLVGVGMLAGRDAVGWGTGVLTQFHQAWPKHAPIADGTHRREQRMYMRLTDHRACCGKLGGFLEHAASRSPSAAWPGSMRPGSR